MSDGDRTGIKRAKLEGKLLRDTNSDGDKSEAELFLLRVVPPCPDTEYEEVKALERVANEDPENIRSYLYERAITLAQNSGCEHGDELETWTHENWERVTTCGRLQAESTYPESTLRYVKDFCQWNSKHLKSREFRSSCLE